MEITINRKYSRSVNIERDLSSGEAATGYILTARGLEVFKRFTQTISIEDTPRSWALVGPYGTGKSSFGLFLTTIVGASQEARTIAARQTIRQSDDALANLYGSKVRGTNGFLKIVLTGKPQSFLKAFASALKTGVERFWKRRPSFYKTICSWNDTFTTEDVIDVLRQIQSHLSENFNKPVGILIIVDELGSFLEYEARHSSSGGIYLLQEIAEQAYKGSSANIYLFTLSHQLFDRYASSLSKNQKDEWAKIQGRFETIPYIEPVEQTLRIVAHAIEAQGKIPDSIIEKIHSTVAVLDNMQALPHGFGIERSLDLFMGCYPLHPSTALLLPLLCQKVAQNERTLFSYIGSEEPFGFRDCLKRTDSDGLIYPCAIFDYFVANYSTSILDHFTYRRWAEVVSALERLGDASESDVNLLKSIGIVNIIGAHGGLKASEGLLREAVGLSEYDFQDSLKRLGSKSLIQYRKFNDEFRVWQGSDFDLDRVLEEELEQIRGSDFVESLNERQVFPYVIASRHSITTGNFRSFGCHCISKNKAFPLPQTTSPRIIYYFSTQDESLDELISASNNSFDVLAISDNYDEMASIVLQVLALDRIGDSHQELKTDPVALREHKDRLLAAREQEEKALRKITTNPEYLKWFWRGKRLKFTTKVDLNVQLSSILDELFYKAPVIRNELINRDSPSVQAVTARNKLILAMLEHSGNKDLGIEKYPAEMAIYKAVLSATGLHVQNGSSWEFVAPQSDHDYRMQLVWDRIQEFIDSTADNPRPFTELDEALQAPPFGIKAGVLPILYAAAYVAHKHELALYEDDKYIPVLPPERYEIFAKRMDLFSIQLFRIQGANVTLLEMYQELFKSSNDGLISVAQPLAAFFDNLPEYSKNTQNISTLAQGIRSGFYKAMTPHELFFVKLPEACGVSTLEPTREELDNYLVVLRKGLKELSEIFSQLTASLFLDLADAFHGQGASYDCLRKALQHRAKAVRALLPSTGDLVAFVRCLQEWKGSNDDWIKRIFGFLAERRCEFWRDEDLGHARNRLQEYANNFTDLEKLSVEHKNSKGNINGAYLIRVVHGGRIVDDVIHLEPYEEDIVSSLVASLSNAMNEKEPSHLKLAALAKIAETILREK